MDDMISNGYYLINSTGQYVYYYTIQYNTYQYGNQVLAYAVPTSLPTGKTAPSNWAGYPTVSRTPYITVTSNNFGTFLGFTAGNYPAAGTTSSFSANSSITSLFSC